jgi:uncharacterized membrane protein
MPNISDNSPSTSPWIRWAIVAVFACVYATISFINHYQFRTYSLDLGMFNQAIYDFAHLRWNHFTLDPTALELNYFGDHFSPITLLYAPFYYIFGSYTLLIIQIIAIIAGGLGIYKYASQKLASEKLALWLLLQFYGVWGIYYALSFDFHNNVVGAMFVPWLVYYYEKKNVKMTLLFYFLFVIAKENMSLWGAFIFLGLWLKNKGWQNLSGTLRYELPLFIGSFLYFGLLVAWLMPLIRQGQGLDQLDRYAHLGSSLPEILKTMIKSPKYVFSLFFETPFTFLNNPIVGIKSELHFVVLLSGGLCFFYRPYYALMLLPIYAQKFLSNNYYFWGISCQYSIEFVPIVVLAVLDVAKGIESPKQKAYLLAFFALLTHIVTYSTMDNSVCYFNKKNIRFYQADHYSPEMPLATIYAIMDTLPNDIPISVSSTLSPHLYQRQKLYNFPIVKDAAYIFLLTRMKPYVPFFKEDSIALVAYRNNPLFEVQYDSLNIVLMKRKN